MGSGMLRIARSRKISIAPRMKPNSRTSTPQKPSISPFQPSQKKRIGVHWKIMEKMLPIPKQETSPMKIQTIKRSFGSTMIRR